MDSWQFQKCNTIRHNSLTVRFSIVSLLPWIATTWWISNDKLPKHFNFKGWSMIKPAFLHSNMTYSFDLLHATSYRNTLLKADTIDIPQLAFSASWGYFCEAITFFFFFNRCVLYQFMCVCVQTQNPFISKRTLPFKDCEQEHFVMGKVRPRTFRTMEVLLWGHPLRIDLEPEHILTRQMLGGFLDKLVLE